MLQITDLSGARFDLAMDRLRGGHAVVFRDITLGIGEDGHLEIVIDSSRFLENVTEQTALSDLERAQTMYRVLCDNPSFAASFEDLTPRFVLIHDYGTGQIELGRLEEGL